MDLQEAFRNCFSKSRKKNNGFPKFKSAKHTRKSYTTNNQKGTVAITNNSIRLPKIGHVKAIIHRKPDDNWSIKSATVSQESRWEVLYFCIVWDCRYYKYLCSRHNQCYRFGLCFDGLYVDNNGNVGTNHKYYRESHDKLAKAQRRLSRMQGARKHEIKSKNYIKQLRKLNKIHRHISNRETW